jgi:PPP family 3-phenylpropionic acid transporter
VPAAPRTLRLYYFTSFAALGVYLPLFPPWLEARGVRGLAMGVVAATLPAMGIVGPPAFGAVADALALRGSLLRIACGGAFAAFGAIAVAAMAGRPLGLAGLLVAASVFAFFRSPMVQLADVVALELERDRAVSYGRLRLFGSLGFLVAAAAAGRWLDPRAPAGLPAVVALLLLGALGSAWLLPAGRGGAPRVPALSGELRRLLAAADVRLFLATAFLSQIAHSAYDLCFSLRLYDLGAPGALVGAAWALGVVAEVGLMAFATPLCARVRPARLVAFGVAGAALRWLLVARVEDPSILLALQPLHALSFAAVWIGFLAWTRARVPGHLLGTVQGVFSASTAAGSVVGMLAWGPLYRRGGGAATFGAAAAVAAVALLVAVRWAGSAEAEPAAKGAPAAAK